MSESQSPPDEPETITVNGSDYTPEDIALGTALLRNSHSLGGSTQHYGGVNMSEDGAILRTLGQQFNGNRDVYATLGYEKDLEIEDYRSKYERGGLAKRLVEAYPDETWRDPPEVSDHDGQGESPFESAANPLIEELLAGYWRRLDIAAGIGEFGVMFLGLADGTSNLAREVDADQLSGTDDVQFVSVFAQDQVHDWTLGKDAGHDETHPRYNKPVSYSLDFSDLDAETTDEDIKEVHWTRTIHFPVNPLESDLKGDPRMKAVFNRLVDLEKVIGSSAEMFWSGADRKILGNVKDGYADLSPDDLANTKADLKKLVHDLQSYMLSSGMEWEVVGGEDPDPSGVKDAIIEEISATVEIPQNKLLGNEMGERATTQDRRNWFDSVSTRRQNVATPRLVRPTINRLVGFGILPNPQGGEYDVEWESLFSLTKEEEANVQLQRSKTLQNIVPKGNTDLLPGGLEAAMEFVESGEFPDADERDERVGGEPTDTPDDAVDMPEESPEAQRYFRETFVNASYSEGDVVDTPDGKGVVDDRLTSSFTFDGDDYDASSDEPLYVVALAEREGVDFYPESDLSSTEFDVPSDVLEEGEKELQSNALVADADEDRLGDLYVQGDITLEEFEAAMGEELCDDATPLANDWNYPKSWRKSDIPSRVILLDAWQSMQASFRGCRAEGFSARFCASMKDKVLGTEKWRGGWAD